MRRARVAWPRLLLVGAVLGGTLMIRASFASATGSVVHGIDIADTYASASHPKHPNGGKLRLYVQERRFKAYLKFSVADIPVASAPTKTVLRLFATRASRGGFAIYRTRSSWSERSLTWRHKPRPAGRPLATIRAVPTRGPLRIVLKHNPVTANGTYSFVLVGTSRSKVYLASRETSRDPRLDLAVPASSPQPSSPPTISGTATDGYILSVSQGTYTGAPAPTVTDAWQVCPVDSAGVVVPPCTSTGDTDTTYTVQSSDVGKRIRVVERATNGSGSAVQQIVDSAIVQPAPPTMVSPPTISGQPVVGQQLTATPGTWDGTAPISYRYQWLSCASSSSCVKATGAGATTSTYTPAAGDLGRTLTVEVTAANSSGSASAQSAPTAPVTPGATSGGGTTSGGTPAPGSTDSMIAAAGDISCDPSSGSYNGGNGTSSACRQKYTAALVQGIPNLAAVLDLGDNQYYCGSYSAYQQVYNNSWGQFLGITHPTPGNHEYLTSGGTGCDSGNANAAGYFKYFGSRAGTPSAPYYSFNIGAWHLISLDSDCSAAGGCDTSSPQGRWLANDLAAHSAKCTLAFWHVPLYSSGGRASTAMQSIWSQLYKAKADVVLNGHDHIYERFAPQNATGGLDTANGIREFVAGTGGANHTSIASVAPNSETRDATTFGVLQLTLHPSSYDWKFVPDTGSGSFTDSGSGTCH